MNKLILLLLSIVFVIKLVQSTTCPVPPSPPCRNYIKFPDFGPNDRLDILWMEAPLMEYVFGNFFGTLHMKHIALGFVLQSDPSINFTVAYVAGDGFIDAWLPIVNSSGSGDLSDVLWCNVGTVCTEEGIDMNTFNNQIYSTANMTLVGSVSGTGFTNWYQNWLLPQQENTEDYDLFAVASVEGQKYLEEFTCQNFAENSLKELSENGATFDCGTTLVQVTPAYLSTFKPIPATNVQDIIAYFALWPEPQDAATITVLELFEIVGAIENYPHHYIYNHNSYYEYGPIKPVFTFSPSVIRIPGCF